MTEDGEAVSAAIRALVKHGGADPNAADHIGLTPLMWDARYGRPGVVAIAVHALVDAGASVTAKTNSGSTALHWAAINSAAAATEAAAALLGAGADVQAATDSGATPLH